MRLWRAFDITYRYSSEIILGLVFTAGQLAKETDMGYLLVNNMLTYQAGLLASFYLLDFVFKTFKHQDFFPKGNMYGHNRGRGMLLRAGRDILQFAANLGGAQLFTYALVAGTAGSQAGAAIGFLLAKILIDVLYDLCENQFAYGNRPAYEII